MCKSFINAVTNLALFVYFFQSQQNYYLQRHEFDAFLEDRLHTIRMWRAVHGNTGLIEPYYCIRGLEMYESAQLNGNVLAARANHIRAVLQEQERQRTAAPNDALDWTALAKSVATRSAWAMRQASRLALKDAMEAQEVWEMDATGFGLGNQQLQQQQQLPLKRLSMPFTGGDLPTVTCASRRLSLPMGSLYNATQRATVDVHKLKEMNRQFLKSMAGFQGTTTATTTTTTACGGGGATTNTNCANKTTPTTSRNNSLAHMLVRGRRLAMNNNNNNQGVENQHRRLAGLAQEASLSLGHGLRRDSLHGLIRDSTADL